MNRGNRLKLSVLIPSHNRQAPLKELLESLAPLKSENIEFIVVINPRGRSPLEKDFPWVKFSESDLGSNPARQQALKLSQGEWCWFIDDDCLLPPSLKPTQLFDLLEQTQVDAYAGTYVLGSATSPYTKAYFIIGDCWQQLSFKIGFPALVGGNLLVRKKVIDESFWPSEIKFGGAELIFNMKAFKNSLRVKHDPQLQMIHNLDEFTAETLALKARLQAQGSRQLKEASIEKFLSHPLISLAFLSHPLYEQAARKEKKEIANGFEIYQKSFAEALAQTNGMKKEEKLWHYFSRKFLIYEALKKAKRLSN